ncbi:nitroreductase family protein [Candidatus Bipolaricaulota bacterium]|nr:nitroreductase family protein [Candidatus Bipolaricaulota bacterium]
MCPCKAIQSRRSIRRFTTDLVERSMIEQLLDAAVLAPSAKNSQPWRFTVVMESRREEMLAVIHRGIANRQTEGEDIGTILSTIKAMEQAPVTIFIHNTDGIHPWKARGEHESWWDLATVQSVGAAIENMLLAATDLGLGSLWIADVWDAYPEINEWLGVDTQLVAAVSLGYADVSPSTPKRKPMDEVVRWIE